MNCTFPSILAYNGQMMGIQEFFLQLRIPQDTSSASTHMSKLHSSAVKVPGRIILSSPLPPSCPCQILPHFNRFEGRGNKECVRQNLIEGLDLTNLDDDDDDSDEPRHEMVVEPRHAWSSATTTTHLCSAVCSTNDLICGKKIRQKK